MSANNMKFGMHPCPRCGLEEDGKTVLAYSYLANFLESTCSYNARAVCTNCQFSIDVGSYKKRCDAVEKAVKLWNAECGENGE